MFPGYQSDRDFVVRRACFHYAGAKYEGRGFLRWQTKEGFKLDLLLERKGPPIANYSFYWLDIPSQSGYTHLIMLLNGGLRAIIPNVYLGQRHDIIGEQRLSFSPYRVVFISRHKSYKDIKPGGRALLALQGHPRFEGSLEKEVKVDGERVFSGSSVGGFRHVENAVSVVGAWDLQDENAVTLDWALDSERGQVQNNWKFAEALRDALAILSGQSAQILSREVCGMGVRRSEVSRRQEITHLGLLSFFGGSDLIRKAPLVKLSLFLAKENSRSRLCRSILSHMFEAARQQTDMAQELLCSMVLEAALRTLYQVPSDRGLHLRQNLRKFQNDFLDQEWDGVMKRLETAFKNLRHRNAHPNWLTTPGGGESPEKVREAVDDMILLSRFYGYMILALAGFRGLKPSFPKPCQEWAPVMTYGTIGQGKVFG